MATKGKADLVTQGVVVPEKAAELVVPATSVVTAQPLPTTVDDLLNGEGVMIRQLTSECCRCLCCQPNIHWTLHPWWGQAVNFDDLPPATMWMQEDAGYFFRCCSCWAPGCRPTVYRTIESAPDNALPTVADNASALTHRKAITCGQNAIVGFTDNGPVRCPMCCCLPYLKTYSRDGEYYGKSQYVCDECLFVPKFRVYDANGTVQYLVRPDTCVCGFCVLCKFGGPKGKCCRVPFPIRDPHSGDKLGDAEITDLWAGFKNECCTRKNIYAVKFPAGATNALKATLVGTTLLMDISLFEQDA